MKKQEILKERWFSFRRLHCLEGFIDVWTGSETEDPNKDAPSDEESLVLTVYYRLDGEGEWLNRKCFDDMMYWLSARSHLDSAKVVWEKSLKPTT